MTPKERAMSEPADPWEGVPAPWKEAVVAYVNTSGAVVSELLQDADPRTVFDAQRDANVTRDRLAALLREAAADQARLDWLERTGDFGYQVAPRGSFADMWLVTLPMGEYRPGRFRDAIDAARWVPSPTPTKEP